MKKINLTKTFHILFTISFISLILTLLRLPFNPRSNYLFMIWNLFLAYIPFICAILIQKFGFKHVLSLIAACILILFLPNAPYMFTDIIHVRISNNNLLFLDFLTMISYSIAGALLWFYSVYTILRLISKTIRGYVLFIWSFVTAFGVYIGRYLRWNSWDFFIEPVGLIGTLFETVNIIHALYTTLFFTILLVFLYKGLFILTQSDK